MTTVEQFCWDNWTPDKEATLLFVIHDSRILLMRKKRGIGAGKINGPGGTLETNEIPRQCAIREVQEELVVTPRGVELCGNVLFQIIDGVSLLIHVFSATHCDGEPAETEEAIPLWTPVDQIPYEQMWADDRYWIPLMLKKETFTMKALFDGDALVSYQLNTSYPNS